MKRNKKGQWVKGHYQGFGFKKGGGVWNKGLKYSEELKKKLDISGLVKGHGWNKNTGKGYFLDKSRGSGYLRSTRACEGGIRLHRQVMERFLKRKLNKNEIVHHIDENTLNNGLDNLLLISRGEHTALHHALKKYSKVS
jgi:hypothetical protein